MQGDGRWPEREQARPPPLFALGNVSSIHCFSRIFSGLLVLLMTPAPLSPECPLFLVVPVALRMFAFRLFQHGGESEMHFPGFKQLLFAWLDLL